MGGEWPPQPYGTWRDVGCDFIKLEKALFGELLIGCTVQPKSPARQNQLESTLAEVLSTLANGPKIVELVCCAHNIDPRKLPPRCQQILGLSANEMEAMMKRRTALRPCGLNPSKARYGRVERASWSKNGRE